MVKKHQSRSHFTRADWIDCPSVPDHHLDARARQSCTQYQCEGGRGGRARARVCVSWGEEVGGTTFTCTGSPVPAIVAVVGVVAAVASPVVPVPVIPVVVPVV